jgi:integrase
MTSKENLVETIKKSRPNAKETTIKMYVSNLMKLMKMFEEDNLKFLDKPEKVSDKLSDLHYTTQRNYYNSIIVYLMSQTDKPEEDKVIKEYNTIRDDLNKKYEEEQASGTISEKQKENFVDISEVNKMIEQMAKEIKEKNIKKKEDLTAKDKALLQVYIIYNIYTRIPLRNDISEMEVINKRVYNKLSETEKKEKNYLVINKNTMFFVLNKFKTSSKYEELKIDIPKDLEKLLRFYIRINGMGVLFKSSTGKPLSRNALSQLLIKTSKKYMGKSISTTMLRKIYLSSKYSKVKEEMEEDAKIMGHSVGVQQSVYVKKGQEQPESETED